jgi:ABC-type polar amino acid transport system ATPase subunit
MTMIVVTHEIGFARDVEDGVSLLGRWGSGPAKEDDPKEEERMRRFLGLVLVN